MIRTELHVTIDPTLVVRGQKPITAQNPDGLVSPAFVVSVVDPSVALTTISPTSVAVGGPDFLLTVNGVAFTSSSQVLWNGAALSTQFVSSTELTANVPASLTATAGSGIVAVQSGNCNAVACDAITNQLICAIGTSTLNIIEQAPSDLAWDDVHGLLYAAEVAAIDPVQGRVVSTLTLERRQPLCLGDSQVSLFI